MRNHAWFWWTARLLLEAGLGVAAVVLLRETDAEAGDHVWGWIAAGASGSAVARLRLLDFGRGEGSRPIGIATAYDPVRGFIEEQIDKRGAEAQANWVRDDLLQRPEISQAPPAVVAQHVIDYLNGLQGISAATRQEEITFIQETRDGSGSDGVKRDLIIRHAIFQLGAPRLFDKFGQS